MKWWLNFWGCKNEELISHSSTCSIQEQMSVCVKLRKHTARRTSFCNWVLCFKTCWKQMNLVLFCASALGYHNFSSCCQTNALTFGFSTGLPSTISFTCFAGFSLFLFLRPSNVDKSSLTSRASMQMKTGERIWQKLWLPYYYSLYTDPFRGPMWKQR